MLPIKDFLKRIVPAAWKEPLKNIYIACLRITRMDTYYFYNKDFATGPWRNKGWAGDFSNLIIKIFDPKSIVDFGCGTADILSPFEKKGITVLGIDGSKYNKKCSKIQQSNFLVFDLRNKYKPKRSYDLCFCFEVAEHIEEKYSDVLISSLIQSSPVILFSASLAMDGVDHVNLHPYEWWKQRFRKYDFYFDPASTSTLKDGMRKLSGIRTWYIDNVMVFRKDALKQDE